MIYSDLSSRVKNISANELYENRIQYHRHCFKFLTNKTKINAARERYERAKSSGYISKMTSPKIGRPSKSPLNQNDSSINDEMMQSRVTQKSVIPFNKLLCAFCQEERVDYSCH